MKKSGHLQKMETVLDSPVSYYLPLDDERVLLNPYIGKHISLNYREEIHCVACGRKTNKSFNQGYCYPCFQSLARCDMCIMKPETCHYFEGTCREPEWGKEFCLRDHFVYLANSSGIKVGITRGTQIPTRWIDQGATQALPVFRVTNRLISGQVEMAIKKHVSDRTDWRKMLKGISDSVDLVQKRDELLDLASAEIQSIEDEVGVENITLLNDTSPVIIEYPVEQYPEKVKSFNFDKTSLVEGVLQGIKGQYLILDTGVLNIRKFGGYRVDFDCRDQAG